MKALILLPLLLDIGCAAKVGPGTDGWAKWDLCGWEGGVSTEVSAGFASWRLGCDSAPPEPAARLEAPAAECEE